MRGFEATNIRWHSLFLVMLSTICQLKELAGTQTNLKSFLVHDVICKQPQQSNLDATK